MAELQKRVSVEAMEAMDIKPAEEGMRGFDPEEDFERDLDEEAIVAEGKDWRNQFTFRAMFVGICTGALLIFVSLTIGLSGAGVSPGYSVTASLIGYALMKPLTSLLIRYYNTVKQFTRQENCIIQATATSIQSLVHALGVSTWLWALHPNAAAQLDLNIQSYDELQEKLASGEVTVTNVIDTSVGGMIGLAFLISFTGVLIVTLFRKLFIVDAKLPFPSPTATAVMINSLFTETGRDLAERQFNAFTKWSGITFVINAVSWIFTRNGCPSFNAIPVFGLAGAEAGWTLNLASYLNFLGVGMIMSRNVSYSLVLGAVVAYGFVYPSIYANGAVQVNGVLPEDAWFDQEIGGMDGFFGYKVMLTLMILLGDGLFALFLMAYIGFSEWRRSRNETDADRKEAQLNESVEAREDRINNRIFVEDGVDNRIIVIIYLLVTLAGCIALPLMYKITWYMVFVAFMLTPIFALVGNYIAGLTDWNVTSNFAKAAALIFGAWGVAVDPENAIVISLICCGIVYCGASNSTDIIGDFKTGHLTRTSPFGMLLAQIIGFAVGCILTPAIFNIFVIAEPDTGFRNARYPNTYGLIYRAMARLAVDGGLDALPKNCLRYSIILFFVSFFSPIFKMATLALIKRSKMNERTKSFVHETVEFLWPSPMAFGIPFLVGTTFVVPVGIGLVVNEIWKFRDPVNHPHFYQIVAAGFLVGPGLWAIPEVVIALAGGDPPLCLTYERDFFIDLPGRGPGFNNFTHFKSQLGQFPGPPY